MAAGAGEVSAVNTKVVRGKMWPVGLDTYAELKAKNAEGQFACTHADKSLFIFELFNREDKVTLITRFRRTGKSMVLDMLHCFLSETVHGRPTAALFEGTLLQERYPDFVRTHQGQYPVIFLDFKGIDGLDAAAVIRALKDRIRDVYKVHAEVLLGSHRLTPAEKK